MTISAKHNLELLKNQVIATAGLRSITPADCKLISALITNKTKNYISETTLKRIYGFALSKFLPSLFTLDALSKFCDYNGWKDYIEKNEKKTFEASGENVNWLTLKQNASKITNFTIEALKNKSGIPFNQTIKRAFIDQHFYEFTKSGSTGTVLVAPAGYGKTISICHWVEEKMASENDIILFFSSTVLTSVLFSGLDLNTWMQSLLGYSALNNFPAPDNKPGNDGVFYLVIDGFDEYRIKDEQFDLILNQIVDFFSCYQTNNKFKLVLTMRTSTWVNNRHEMENSNSSWFTGFNDSEEAINVHLFNNAEIKQLSNNLNPNIKDAIPADLPDGFKHPLYFQLFYKQHKENFSFDSVDLTSEYELNSLFILNKIYLGKYSAEKILFIKKLVESMEFENENYRVDKLKVNDYVRKYDHAYKELLSAGILKELNESNNFQYNTYIKFDNDYFLVHSIAKTLLYSNDDRFDSVLVQKINTLFAKSPNKLSVLKWCIIHAIKTGQQDSFERLTEANLSSNEKSELIIFLGDLLNKEFTSMKGNELFFQYFNQDFSKKMFDYFFGIELISNDYKKTLYTILKFELSARKKILVYTALAITAVINLNLEDLEQHLKKLRSFPVSDYQSFAVNPLTCIDTLYHFLKYGIVKKDALTELTKLSFHPPEDEYNLTQCASNDMLYLLGMHTMFITYNAKKLLRFINVIGKFYKSDSLDVHTSQYGFFVNMLKGDAYYKLHQLDKVAEVYYMVSNAYKKSENLLTPYMKTQFHCLKIKLMIDTPREGSVINEMKCIDAISEISGSRVTRLYTLAMLQGKQEFMHEHPNFKKHVNYEYQKLMRTNNISSDMFTVQKSMVNK